MMRSSQKYGAERLFRAHLTNRFGSRTAIGHFATVATASSATESGCSLEIGCSLRATLGWIGSASAGGGVRYLRRVSVSKKPAHMSSRTFSNACDQELNFHRQEIR